MNSIILNPIFQIVTTAILTLLGTAWITRHFYKKHKKDNDKPKIKYWVENFNNKPLLRLERSPFDHIHNFTLTSISQYSKTNYCPWRESIKSLKSYEIDIPFQIPKPQCNMYCTAYGFLDHSLKEDCATLTISLKGVSNGETKKIHA